MTNKTRTLGAGTVGVFIAVVVGLMTIIACSTFEQRKRTSDDGGAGSRTSQHDVNQAPMPASDGAQYDEAEDIGAVLARERKERTLAKTGAPPSTTNLDSLRLHQLRALGYSLDNSYIPAPPEPELNAEQYDMIAEKGFLDPTEQPLSTFSIDVDTASYSNVRRILKSGVMPPSGAVRIEELVNYFSYNYPAADNDVPVSVMTETSQAPWAPNHQLVMVGLKGVEVEEDEMPPRNLTFLMDVSGSMQSPDKLDLVVRALKGVTKTLRPEDHVSIVVYAGASGLVLPPTSGDERRTILKALDRLRAGGSTNGGEGIRLAYKIARKHFDGEGINRVILASDGDFNVGITNRGDLRDLIEEERKSGVFLTVLGVGSGNLKDATMEELADHGNGNYAYLDSIGEARKVLIRESGSTLVTVAKDVKLQVEFNPARVAGYRLIGYSNRRLEDRDFNDDRKDAGDLGAGHSVTALYEVIPHGASEHARNIDPLRYQRPAKQKKVADRSSAKNDELLTVKVRYKRPTASESQLITRHTHGESKPISEASEDLRFASAVAAFGMLLRESPYVGDASWDLPSGLARDALGSDPHGDRAEFLYLVREARQLSAGMGS